VSGVATAETVEQPVFFYDLGDPRCYLTAEAIMSRLPAVGGRVPEFEPVLWPPADPGAGEREQIERTAIELGIQPLRWPQRWPPDTRTAMLAATYAKRIGRAVAFSLAAFRQAFAGGRDLGDEDTVLIAGAACEIHPTALLRAVATRSVAEALEAACARAEAAGVSSLPAIRVGAVLFDGDGALERAAAALGATAEAGGR
jgi:2-hydroxychromene-2-carboxylate isomerase